MTARRKEKNGSVERRSGALRARIPFSRTVFETERLNLGRLLTRIGRETDVRSERGGKGPRFSVPSRDAAKVVAICECLCYNYKIIKERGIALFFVRALGRAGVVLGALLSLALLILYPMFVIEVEYSGDEIPSVRRAVEESGVREWAFLPAFDGGELERRLLALDGVAFASVTKRGTRVYVDVHAEREGPGFVDIPSGEVKAFVAASVTRVVVRSGTAEVGYGDVVKPGDVLIGAYVMSGEETVPCPADGEVFGLVSRTVTRFFPDTEIVREYGRVHREARLSFNGDAPVPPESPFEDHILEVSVSRNEFLLGYELYTYVFREVSYVERANALSEEEMAGETEGSFLAGLPSDAEILSLETKCTRGEGGVYVELKAQTEERISG